ncbi:MAG: HEAT repeat domain-containing protein [Sandaracinaceae bacterium]
MIGRSLGRRLATGVLLALALGVLGPPRSANADARSDYLIRALRTSPGFRVRAQAAISLGGVATAPEVVDALRDALEDGHPAVRAAAAAALERHGDPSVLPQLRRAASDREAVVRNAATHAITALERVARTRPRTRTLPDNPPSGGGAARFYVAVGTPGSRVRGVTDATLRSARAIIEREAQTINGVRIAPDDERPRAAQQVMSRDNLVGFYLDSSIVAIEEQPGGALRARVSVVLQTYPDRNIRSMLSGAATVMGASGETARQQAIEGALRGALRSLPQAMAAASGG